VFSKQVILIICYRTNKSYIESYFKQNKKYEVVIDTLEDIEGLGVKDYVEKKISQINSGKLKINGIAATSDQCNAIVAILAKQTGKIGTSLESILACQNKYISRLKQKEICPKNCPDFCLAVSNHLKFPVFVKPVRSSLSFHSFKVTSSKALIKAIESGKAMIPRSNKLYQEIIDLGYFRHKNLNDFNNLICEEIVTGEQITVDGYIYKNKVVLFGITKSIFLPNKISFTRFDYPYEFEPELNNKIESLSKKLASGLGLNNTLFNIEFVVNLRTNKIFIIEINGRLSLQFAHLIHTVSGYNPLEAMADISVGKEPGFFLKNENKKYKICSSCVLRKRFDHRVLQVPQEKELDTLSEKHSDIQITSLIQEGKKLSDYRQDSKTFRYAIVDIPGNDLCDIKRKLYKVRSELKYRFSEL